MTDAQKLLELYGITPESLGYKTWEEVEAQGGKPKGVDASGSGVDVINKTSTDNKEVILNTAGLLAGADSLEDIRSIYKNPPTTKADYGLGESKSTVTRPLVKRADELDIPLVEHIGDDRYAVADIGIGLDDNYVRDLTDQGLLPENPLGWEVHRTKDGKLRISTDEPEKNVARDLFKGIVTAAITGGAGGAVGSAVGGGLLGNAAGTAVSAALDGAIKGDFSTDNLLNAIAVNAATGMLGFGEVPREISKYEPSVYDFIKPSVENAIEYGDIAWQKPDVSDVPGQVQVQVPDYSTGLEGGGGDQEGGEGSPGGSGGDEGEKVPQGSPPEIGTESPFPSDVYIEPNHEERDDEVWRHTNPDGTVVAGNDMGEVWEVDPGEEYEEVIDPVDLITTGLESVFDQVDPDIVLPQGSDTGQGGTGDGGTGDGTGDGTGGEGTGDGTGTGGDLVLGPGDRPGGGSGGGSGGGNGSGDGPGDGDGSGDGQGSYQPTDNRNIGMLAEDDYDDFMAALAFEYPVLRKDPVKAARYLDNLFAKLMEG